MVADRRQEIAVSDGGRQWPDEAGETHRVEPRWLRGEAAPGAVDVAGGTGVVGRPGEVVGVAERGEVFAQAEQAAGRAGCGD